MEDDIVQLCATAIFPKLPFLLEEKEEANLKAFFANPEEYYSNIGEATESGAYNYGNNIPIPVTNRKVILVKILKKIEDDPSLNWWKQLASKSRAEIILFLSESADEMCLWSDKDCSGLVVKICNEVSKSSINEFDCSKPQLPSLAAWFRKNYSDCLTPNETDFHYILKSVRAKYNKTDWKYFPASVHGFGWIIQQIDISQLTNFIDLILPPALLFSDDHYDDHKILGLRILAYIADNCEKTDLVRNNWANVIYDAVYRHLTDKDPIVIELMMSILLKMLDFTEKDPSMHSSEFTKYDNLLKQILFQMEFGSEINQKRCWLPILDNFMNKLGLATLHWSDRICDVLRDYSICSDFGIWSKVLDVTATLIKNTWLKPDTENICEIILRVIFNISSFHAVCINDKDKSQIIEKASHCLQLLQKTDNFDPMRNQLKEIMESRNSQHFHSKYVECLKQIFEQINI